MLTGRYADGLGNIKSDERRVDYQPFPHYAAAVWLMMQLRRWNMLKEDVDYKKLAEQVMLATDAAKIMRDLGATPPAVGFGKEIILGQEFDSSRPRNISSRCAAPEGKWRKGRGRPGSRRCCFWPYSSRLWHLLTVERLGGAEQPSIPNTRRLAARARPSEQTAAIPTPGAVARRGYELLVNAFDRTNPNNLGIAWHLLYSMGRVLLGYVLAVIVAVPHGFRAWDCCRRSIGP